MIGKIFKLIKNVLVIKKYNKKNSCHITNYTMNLKQLEYIGKEVRINKGCTFPDPNGKISIDDYSYINSGYLYNCVIGKYCSIGQNVSLGPGEHYVNHLSTFPISNLVLGKKDLTEFKASLPAMIGNDVWIGNNAVILQGIKVGDGAIVAAGAVVTKDVEPYSIVGGVPARVIKKRFDEVTIQKLMDLAWWKRGEEWIRSNRDLFVGELVLGNTD
nr:CatB-related O-acetyltransferase [uncultured Blautia sp.]